MDPYGYAQQWAQSPHSFDDFGPYEQHEFRGPQRVADRPASFFRVPHEVARPYPAVMPPLQPPAHFGHEREVRRPPLEPPGFAPNPSYFNAPRPQPKAVHSPARFFGPHVPQQTRALPTPHASMPENSAPVRADFVGELQDDPTNPIRIDVQTSSRGCTAHWRFLQRFQQRGLYVEVALYEGKEKKVAGGIEMEWAFRQCSTHNLSDRTREFDLRPGGEYAILVRVLVIQQNEEIARNCKDFRAVAVYLPFRSVYSRPELKALLDLAVRFCGENPQQKFHELYRCKPRREYFDRVIREHRGVMLPYRKDACGHPASPINKSIKGLFFSCRLVGGQVPDCSPFGDACFTVEAAHLLRPNDVNFYFADFYCITQIHYATLVVCRKGSPQDLFCERHAIQLDVSKNPFLMVGEMPLPHGGFVPVFHSNNSRNLHVEVMIADRVPLNWGHLHAIHSRGLGTSSIEGVANNRSCTVCNLPSDLEYERQQAIIRAPLVSPPAKPRKENFESFAPSPPSASSSSKDARKRSTGNSKLPDEKRTRWDSATDRPKAAGTSERSTRTGGRENGAGDANKTEAKKADAREKPPAVPKPTEGKEDDDEIVFVCEVRAPAPVPVEEKEAEKAEAEAPPASATPTVVPPAATAAPVLSIRAVVPTTTAEDATAADVPAEILVEVPVEVPDDPKSAAADPAAPSTTETTPTAPTAADVPATSPVAPPSASPAAPVVQPDDSPTSSQPAEAEAEAKDEAEAPAEPTDSTQNDAEDDEIQVLTPPPATKSQ